MGEKKILGLVLLRKYDRLYAEQYTNKQELIFA